MANNQLGVGGAGRGWEWGRTPSPHGISQTWGVGTSV